MDSVGKRHASENQYRSGVAFIPEPMKPTLREYCWSREGIVLVISSPRALDDERTITVAA
jgi:hypothetical protein